MSYVYDDFDGCCELCGDLLDMDDVMEGRTVCSECDESMCSIEECVGEDIENY